MSPAARLLVGLVILAPAVRDPSEAAASGPAGATTAVPADDRSADVKGAARIVFDLTNGFRREQDRPALKPSDVLAKTAQDFAEFMASTDKYGHEADGQQPDQRARKHGYDECIIAENIAFEFNSEGFETEELAKSLVKGWENSPGHRKNMLDPDVTEAGMGVARGEKSGKYYAVQLFGRPKAEAVEFQIENKTDGEISYTLGEEKLSLPAGYTRTHGMCRPAELKFAWGDGEGGGVTVKPARGDRFVVAQEQGKYRVTKAEDGAAAAAGRGGP